MEQDKTIEKLVTIQDDLVNRAIQLGWKPNLDDLWDEWLEILFEDNTSAAQLCMELLNEKLHTEELKLQWLIDHGYIIRRADDYLIEYESFKVDDEKGKDSEWFVEIVKVDKTNPEKILEIYPWMREEEYEYYLKEMQVGATFYLPLTEEGEVNKIDDIAIGSSRWKLITDVGGRFTIEEFYVIVDSKGKYWVDTDVLT